MPTTTTPSHPKPASPRRSPPIRPWFRSALKLLILVAVAGTFVYRLKLSPVSVVAHQVARGPVVAEVMGTGTLEARVEATISPKIQGRLAELLVDQNDRVEAGQPLGRLDDAEWKEQVAVAKAGLDAAMATVERVRADEARTQAVLNQAQLDHARALDLRKANVAAQADLDKAVESLRVGEADLNRALAAITEAERQRVTAEKTLAYHQARLADTQLLSPFDGLVVRRDRDPGDVVVPGSSILQLISTNELWISAWVDETAMADLSPGQKARVVFRSEPARSYIGEVARLGRQTDRETREFLVDVRVTELPANWAVGQRAEVYIETARKPSTLVIPKGFVAWREGKPGTFVDVDGKARWKDVSLGLQNEAFIEVRQGLHEGEHVVKPGGGKRPALADGQRIKES
ncbi:MAG: efflux RND transporter periplasmic adaptor subunit [Verrucomicrobia bacterium]|nr:efflux RND transporter periplasmic adaptor subunit [Verrucomicrobiota bacterium]